MEKANLKYWENSHHEHRVKSFYVAHHC